jgi:hypothetical protein
MMPSALATRSPGGRVPSSVSNRAILVSSDVAFIPYIDITVLTVLMVLRALRVLRFLWFEELLGFYRDEVGELHAHIRA